VTITIENAGSAAEVPVTLRSANGERTERVLVRARDKTVVRIPLPEEPVEVRLNDGSVPEGDRSDNFWRPAPQNP